ncbi:hypothetical protein [Pontibacillus yanchengensis]|uniref:Uncharacterized protein n=1 Tax=Pontibacillus yanchengensis Y32 TaxID=1385514 RepID=A0A0A2TW02_9BACI|nr:hypothetical protein [Pontibacillus yanchengensis]KGP73465.1 hypothetical protein N782_05120 [Pontibacillus yanchengensis Y32]
MNDELKQELNRLSSDISNSLSDVGAHIDMLKKGLGAYFDEFEAIHTQLIIQNVLLGIIAFTLITGVFVLNKNQKK